MEVVIARSEATHPRVASLAPLGQFTFWQSVPPVGQMAHASLWLAKERIATGLRPSQ